MYSIDGKPIGHKIPYIRGPGRAHFCCRSTETLVLKSWREMGIPVDEMPPGTRASMDGQQPAETTYADWLSRQSLARQKAVLGDTRARLLQAGRGGSRPEGAGSDLEEAGRTARQLARWRKSGAV
ncbi:hypothetical protein [Pantoea agglomerans]|uniref:hypothetical protein n=1 Tax=Enterobacter agglomerans TaxID=549 RepID=UPI003C7A9FE6